MAIKTIHVAASCPLDCSQREICGRCLKEKLHEKPGIRAVELRASSTDGQATLELDYDPRLITLAELEAEVRNLGFCLTPDRATMVLGIEGMVSPRTEQAVEAMLSKLPGVTASASFASQSLRVEFDRRQCVLPEIARRLGGLGLRIRQSPPPPQEMPGQSRLTTLLNWARDYCKLIMAGIGGAMLLGAFLVHTFGDEQLQWLRIALIVPAYVFTGWYTFRDTVKTLLAIQFDIDVLMFAAAIGAAVLGQYEEGGLLLFLFALGGAGEEMAMDRARRAIQALAKLAPDTATVRHTDGRERLVRVEDLQFGQQVVVRPFDRFPADGTVVAGASAVDQSPITGESIPIEKTAGMPVFAGTINGEGLLLVGVTKLAGQSTLAKIIQMVNEAQTTKSPTQVFTDKVERHYVPIVLIATALLIFIPPLLGFKPMREGSLWAGWFYQAMAFLTAASPCALAIGTPAAVLSGIARAARIGVLVKGGVHLENLGRVNAVAFDKTGTLTRGRAEMTDLISLNGQTDAELLAIAAAVERGSTHPLAKAIVAEAQARQCPEHAADDVEQIAGKGVSARVNGSRVTLGHVDLVPMDHPRLDAVNNAMSDLARQGKTTVVMLIDDEPAAVIGLADRPRDNAADTLRRLKRLGIARTIMLTGDHSLVADAIARQIGVDEHFGELLPEDKASLLCALEERYGPMAMVGDGVNDAPAMAGATVGVAMGGAGTDVAIETADVVLMADDLAKLPDAIGLSRFSRKIIKQNLTIALGVIAVLAPLSALGYAYLGVAVLFHEGSTVVVVLNSLRLLMYKPK